MLSYMILIPFLFYSYTIFSDKACGEAMDRNDEIEIEENEKKLNTILLDQAQLAHTKLFT